jgi:hypothetical protein
LLFSTWKIHAQFKWLSTCAVRRHSAGLSVPEALHEVSDPWADALLCV